jgi:ubiquinone/menaquinone biosynthesis C-methylase UbiE
MYLIILILLFIVFFINRILLNENYQEYINVGFFYFIFCKDIEQELFMKFMGSTKNKFDNNSKILDFGCGSGIMSKFFGNNYVGIDIDKTRIDYAKQIYPNKTFISYDPNNYILPFTDNYFEIILFNDCLHHIDNYTISKLLPELQRILQIDGKIIIREPKKDTNFFTYFITELCENGNYVRTSYEYKNIFKSCDIISEEFHNEIFRDYYILTVKNKKNNDTFNDLTTTINIDRHIMNIITLILFSILIIQIISVSRSLYYKRNN